MVFTQEQENERHSDHKLLSEAESWTPGQVEENSMLLLETATSVLTLSDSSPELKLDSLRYKLFLHSICVLHVLFTLSLPTFLHFYNKNPSFYNIGSINVFFSVY